MFDVERQIDLQDKIVRCFASSLDVRWDYVLIDFERIDDGDVISHICEMVFQREGAAWNRVSVIAPTEGHQLLYDLANLMSEGGKQAWSSCILELDAGGGYRFSFSHEPNRRLNGDLNAALAEYVPRTLS
jgi:hypothetical protein